MKMKKAFFIAFFCISSVLVAREERLLTGNLRFDLLTIAGADTTSALEQPLVPLKDEPVRKNPLLGGVFSLAVPGAGEIYSERYVKGAIFLGVEIAAIATYLTFEGKADDKTAEFEKYADAHWSAVRYALWLNNYAAKYRADGKNASIVIDANTSLPSWERVSLEEINAFERGQFSEGFSHTLPAHGEQQYYELIGKYNQFKFGWSTYPVDGQGIPLNDKSYNEDIPQEMIDYAVERGKANRFYYNAGIATSILIINHVLSALDGAWSVSRYNKEISTEVRVKVEEPAPVSFVPQATATLTLRF